jgi:hypothetical protein
MLRVFLPVPTEYLELDPQTSRNAAKLSESALRAAVSTIPELYRRIDSGACENDFRRMNGSADPKDRLIGETYRHLFSGSASAQPLRAEFLDGRGLLVTAGQHRVLEARKLGVAYLPVHVEVPDREHLDRLRSACEQEVLRRTPELSDVPAAHRRQDQCFYPGRDRDVRPVERHPGPERLEPEREIGWRFPERER